MLVERGYNSDRLLIIAALRSSVILDRSPYACARTALVDSINAEAQQQHVFARLAEPCFQSSMAKAACDTKTAANTCFWGRARRASKSLLTEAFFRQEGVQSSTHTDNTPSQLSIRKRHDIYTQKLHTYKPCKAARPQRCTRIPVKASLLQAKAWARSACRAWPSVRGMTKPLQQGWQHSSL